MPAIVDFHTHVFPATIEKSLLDRLPGAQLSKLEEFRKRARGFIKPFSKAVHRAQTVVRHLPEGTRDRLDRLTGIVPFPNLLFESTPNDLIDAMNEASVDHAVIVAHPPVISNEFVLELASDHPRLVAAVNLPPGTQRSKALLTRFHKRGARLLMLHPAADGEGPDSKHYAKLLPVAEDLGLPVAIHTGKIHSHVLYKSPEMGRAELFEPWFEKYKKIQFVLAHMNFHDPQRAMDIAQRHENVFLDTSWQPPEAIGEAVRRVGADRVLFASDWPFVGNNLKVGLKRIRECLTIGLLNEEQSEQILGTNALKLLGLRSGEEKKD